MSGGKETLKGSMHSNIQSPVNSCDQFLRSAKQTEEGVLGYPSGCISI
jgi:hypothetical protein